MLGAVRTQDDGFVITLTMKDASGRPAGERRVRVDAQRCSEIVRPTSLVLAMMIAVAGSPTDASSEPEAPAETSPPAAPAPPGEEAPPRGERPPAARPPSRAARPTAPPRRSHRFLAGVGGALSRGVLPDVGLGFALHATYAWRSLSVGIEGRFEDAGSVPVDRGAASFHLFGIGARLGITALRTGPIELVPMIGGSLAWIDGSARGFRAVYENVRTTGLVGPGVLGRFALTRSLSVELLAEVDCVLVRDRFAVRGGGKLIPLHRPSPFAPRVSLGMGYEF